MKPYFKQIITILDLGFCCYCYGCLGPTFSCLWNKMLMTACFENSIVPNKIYTSTRQSVCNEGPALFFSQICHRPVLVMHGAASNQATLRMRANSLQRCPALQPCGLQPTRLLCPWDSPGKNTGVACHDLLQGIFLTQESNPNLLHLLHWQACSLPLAPPGRSINLMQTQFKNSDSLAVSGERRVVRETNFGSTGKMNMKEQPEMSQRKEKPVLLPHKLTG